MTEAHARRLVAGEYVASLNQRMPVGYKVTRVVESAPTDRVVIQVAQLYGDDLVFANAFHRVADGPTLTRAEVNAIEEERTVMHAIIAAENAIADETREQQEPTECAA